MKRVQILLRSVFKEKRKRKHFDSEASDEDANLNETENSYTYEAIETIIEQFYSRDSKNFKVSQNFDFLVR